MTRLYGWGPTDRRLVESVPHGHWMTTTFVAALRADGLVAPLVVDGAITGDIFRAWVEQQLVHELRPGDIVVMDNLAAHKVAGVREAIRAVDADVLYLPPYSPDLNPIEPVFAKVKHEIRKRKPRTKAACDALCGECLDWFPAHRMPQLPPTRRLHPARRELKMLYSRPDIIVNWEDLRRASGSTRPKTSARCAMICSVPYPRASADPPPLVRRPYGFVNTIDRETAALINRSAISLSPALVGVGEGVLEFATLASVHDGGIKSEVEETFCNGDVAVIDRGEQRIAFRPRNSQTRTTFTRYSTSSR